MSLVHRASAALAGSVLVSGMIVAGAISASAGGIAASTVTSVTGASGYSITDLDHPDTSATITATGTASGAGAGDTVDVRCYYDDAKPFSYKSLAENVPITDGAWTATGNAADIAGYTCRILAVPSGWTTALTDPGSASFHPSGVITIGQVTRKLATTGPSTGTLRDFDLSVVGAKSVSEFNSADSCGPYTYLTTPVVHEGEYLWDCVLSLFQSDEGNDNDSATPNGNVRLGGDVAYTPDSLNPTLALTHGAVTLSYSQNSKTGDAVVVETDPYYYCLNASQQVSDNDEPETCAGIRYTGVTLHRRYQFGHGGETIVLSDQFVSTDHQAHPLALEYDNELSDAAVDLGYKTPGASTYSQPADNTAWSTHSWPQIGSLGLEFDQAATPSVDNPVGLLSWSTKPNSAFYHDHEEAFFNYSRRIPASGSWTLTQSLAMAASQSVTNKLAALEIREDRPSMTARHLPKRTAKRTVVIHGRVVNGGNGAITSVKAADGHRKATAKVSSNGKFAVRIRLSKGHNRIVISGTDPAGNKAKATVSTKRL